MENQLNFPHLEQKILKFWREKNIFKKSLAQNKETKPFVFFEGPPTANGLPGIHHVLARAFKDLIPRFKTMQGYFVDRKAGWDTHGLPVEIEVEKKLKISGKPAIEKYGVAKFNAECKKSVWAYKEEWEKMTERLGFWLDLTNPYITYANYYIESLWWILKQAWDKKLIYLGHKVVPQCPRCGTALSSHEVAQGYQQITEESIYLKFALAQEPHTYVLAWTTTPWTLPGNVALALGPKIKYVKVKQGNDYYILAEEKLNILEGKYEIVEKCRAEELAGKKYRPLFDWLDLGKITGKDAYYLALADFVTTEEGTGVVHTAVMYGEDDYNLGEKLDLPKYHTVDPNGRFTTEVKPWAGRFVKETQKEITEDLAKRGLIYKKEMTTHDYPFCWRCDSPLLYYAKNSWFIKMSALKKQLIENNKKINWQPAYIKEGRFGEWLREVKDWAISRERYWGTPLPFWHCSKCGQYECLASFQELQKRALKPVDLKTFDPHRPLIDEIKLKCHCGGEMSRVAEVADCWFDSGAMPFSQWGYPYQKGSEKELASHFPADYIAEAIDQTRGWFYTLLAVATILNQKLPYKNVICLGHIKDAKGRKMSKSRGNVIDPWTIFDKSGADPLRFYLYTMNQPGDSKNFDPKGLDEVIKKVFIVLWNVLSFYKLYEDEESRSMKHESKKLNLLDQWILARLSELIIKVQDCLEKYLITEAGREIAGFINELSTWYLRRSRDRFKAEDTNDKKAAGRTLRHVILELSKIMAPFTPFLAEEIYQEVAGEKESVHLEAWPKAKKLTASQQKLMAEMEEVKEIVTLGHAIRAENKIKVRQPLGQLAIVVGQIEKELARLILKELNVSEIVLVKKLPVGPDWLAKESAKVKIALNCLITDELKEKGTLREITRQLNDLRKKSGLTIKDRIEVHYQTDDQLLKKLLENYQAEIKKEVLADQLISETKIPDSAKEIVLDGEKIRFYLTKK